MERMTQVQAVRWRGKVKLSLTQIVEGHRVGGDIEALHFLEK
jgi:hypothetical protein